jgi:hypothetical protein
MIITRGSETVAVENLQFPFKHFMDQPPQNHPGRVQSIPAAGSEVSTGRVRELEKEVMDLKITNRGKDYFIEQLQKERGDILDQLLTANRQVGELETKLLQLESPTGLRIEGGAK